MLPVGVEGGPAWLLPPHPVAPTASATDNARTSRPPSLRLRGSMSSSSEAMVTPEPAAYQVRLACGVAFGLPGFWRAYIVPGSTCPGRFGRCRVAVVSEGGSGVVCGGGVPD